MFIISGTPPIHSPMIFKPCSSITVTGFRWVQRSFFSKEFSETLFLYSSQKWMLNSQMFCCEEILRCPTLFVFNVVCRDKLQSIMKWPTQPIQQSIPWRIIFWDFPELKIRDSRPSECRTLKQFLKIPNLFLKANVTYFVFDSNTNQILKWQFQTLNLIFF